MNMFKSVGANSDDEYIDQLDEDRKEIIKTLDELIRKTAPSLKRWFASNMLGYGEFNYQNYKKQVGKWPTIALASQKNYISLYVCAIDPEDDTQYLAEKYTNQLGKVSVGKSCIRFKKIEDLNLEIVKKLIQDAEKSPGLVGAKKVA